MRQASRHCELQNICGGCHETVVDGTTRLYQNYQDLKHRFRTFGLPSLPLPTFHPSPLRRSYRRRVELRVRFDIDGTLSLGFFAKGSRDLCEINSCPVATPAINGFISRLRQSKNLGSAGLRLRMELQDLQAGEGGLLVILHAVKASDVESLMDRLRGWPEVRWCGVAGAAEDSFCLEVEAGLKFRLYPGAFLQSHETLNRRLRFIVDAELKEATIKHGKLLDLYCGNGNLSLKAASQGVTVTGVEQDARAIDGAKRSAKGLPATYVGQSVIKWLSESKADQHYDVVIVDPPRVGMGQVGAWLVKLSWQKLIYVSCAPSALVNDLASLQKAGLNFELKALHLVEMFPHTKHFEVVLVLTRVSKPFSQ